MSVNDDVPRMSERSAARNRGGRSTRNDWQERFLRNYAEWGSRTKAAAAAGVSVRTVRKHELANPAFAEEIKAAHEAFVDGLELRLVEMSREKGGFLPLIARLKSELPLKYNDKLQIDGAVKHLHGHAPISHEEAVTLLREMLNEMTETSRAQLATLCQPAIDVDADCAEP